MTLLIAAAPEEALLAGPCRSEVEFKIWHAMVTRFDDRVKTSDHHGAAELARDIVRGACRNEWWWYKMAGEYYIAGSPKKAVEVLEVMQARKSNTVAQPWLQRRQPSRD